MISGEAWVGDWYSETTVVAFGCGRIDEEDEGLKVPLAANTLQLRALLQRRISNIHLSTTSSAPRRLPSPGNTGNQNTLWRYLTNQRLPDAGEGDAAGGLGPPLADDEIAGLLVDLRVPEGGGAAEELRYPPPLETLIDGLMLSELGGIIFDRPPGAREGEGRIERMVMGGSDGDGASDFSRRAIRTAETIGLCGLLLYGPLGLRPNTRWPA
ncbi:hypothetical protein OPV22_016129 [Ensete ventricosum]|uniref:Uncharacterized protein n=1 Tax=Ensete ventricosum TaxID=4639 RepID=A0AAV8QZ13_ENSVE|nr:hypothetical protein OPV22_016129 [Ensete ventricosum]